MIHLGIIPMGLATLLLDKSSSLAAFFTASFFYANGILQAQGSPTNVCVEQDCGRLQLKVQSIDSELTLTDSNHLCLGLTLTDSNASMSMYNMADPPINM